MSRSQPNLESVPSVAAREALTAVEQLSTAERRWVYEQLERQQAISAESICPEWRAELVRRVRALQDGSAELHDLESVEAEALELLGR